MSGTADDTAQPEILVADDDSAIRQLLSRRLEQEDYDCQTFPDGQAAADALQTDEIDPDLGVFDVMMPRLDGKRLLRKLRNGDFPVDEDTPVIMLTSRSREQDVLDGFESGADDYIAKPFSPAEVVARIQNHLG